MAIRKIRLLGDPLLYERCRPLGLDEREKTNQVAGDLRDTMAKFVAEHGFGRAMAAPQIGESVRMIYFKVEGKETVFVNPRIEFPDDEQFEMWDDCMSFPGLEVRLLRYKVCRVTYLDLRGKERRASFEGDLSELFQHEYDHLEGILAVQRALDQRSYRMNPAKMKRCAPGQ
jgi:peptide deformylase